MCGIVGGPGFVDRAAVDRLRHRGPDATGAWQGSRYWLGHTRLSIIDVGSRSDQPFARGDVVLVYNGELWNYRELRAELALAGERFTTEGDTEVVAAALARWGEEALPRFEGMFALAWTADSGATLRLARDRHGEVPLHLDARTGAFASELKALPPGAAAGWVEPGSLVQLGPDGIRARFWYVLRTARSEDPAPVAIRRGIGAGVTEREVSDVGFCILLSGGLDSSIIAHHVAEHRRGVVAYTAVGQGSPADERAAREVAERFGLELRTVKVPQPSADDLARVVRAIEMPHKAQIEIGWACYHLAQTMRADGQRVTFSGEGSDELWASYGMSYHGIQKDGWYGYRRRLFRDQHRKNFARCNKIFMAAGVECRLPFLSTHLVELALTLAPGDVRSKARPKLILEQAYADVLPERVLTRAKMTFQDGAGLQAACAKAVADPARFYKAEFSAAYPGVRP